MSSTRPRHRAIDAAHVLPVCILLTGCAAAKPPPVSPCSLPVTLDVAASAAVNPDESGAPLPTVVRIVQLSHAVRAEESDFAQLWEQLDETLGDQLVRKRELTVYPGQVAHVSVELDTKTRYLLGMAVFRVPTGTQWRTVVPLPASERLCAAYGHGVPSPAVRFALDGYRIEARSRLLKGAARSELPADVASRAENARAR